jgi:hypothetical protein
MIPNFWVNAINYGVKTVPNNVMGGYLVPNKVLRNIIRVFFPSKRDRQRTARFEKRCEQIKRNHFKPKWINGRIKRRVVPSPKPDRWSEG